MKDIKEVIFDEECDTPIEFLDSFFNKVISLGNSLVVAAEIPIPDDISFLSELFPDIEDRTIIMTALIKSASIHIDGERSECSVEDLHVPTIILYGIYKRIKGLEATIETLKEGIAHMEKV